jgi:hypothetical protein
VNTTINPFASAKLCSEIILPSTFFKAKSCTTLATNVVGFDGLKAATDNKTNAMQKV